MIWIKDYQLLEIRQIEMKLNKKLIFKVLKKKWKSLRIRQMIFRCWNLMIWIIRLIKIINHQKISILMRKIKLKSLKNNKLLNLEPNLHKNPTNCMKTLMFMFWFVWILCWVDLSLGLLYSLLQILLEMSLTMQKFMRIFNLWTLFYLRSLYRKLQDISLNRLLNCQLLIKSSI